MTKIILVILKILTIRIQTKKTNMKRGHLVRVLCLLSYIGWQGFILPLRIRSLEIAFKERELQFRKTGENRSDRRYKRG